MSLAEAVTTGSGPAAPIEVSHHTIVIVIAAYNEERFIGKTIESLRNQTCTDFAVLISDNASTDRTEEVARAAIGGDPRFHLYRQPRNLGSMGNGNFLLEASKSPFFLAVGAHDMLAPTYLEKVLPPLIEDANVTVSFSETIWIDETDREIRRSSGWMDTLPRLPVLRYVLTPRMNDLCTEINNILRRSALEGVVFTGTWGTDGVALAHLAYRGRFHRTPEPLFYRRELTTRAESYMKRLTGKEGQEDYGLFIQQMIDQLRKIGKGDRLVPVGVFILSTWLPYRYGLRTRGPAAVLLGTATRLKTRLKAVTGWRRRGSWN